MGWELPPEQVGKKEESKKLFIACKRLKDFGCSRLSDFIETAPGAAQLKDAQTGRYLLANHYIAKQQNLQSIGDLVGLTVGDFVEKNASWKQDFSPAFVHWKNKEAEKIENLDLRVRISRSSIVIRRLLFASEGAILFQRMIKHPIFDADNKHVISILSCSTDLTLQRGLFGLLRLYLGLYPDKQQAIRLLLKYLRINHYFTDLPTVRELQILFAMYQHTSRKRIARRMHVSHNTVASHLQHLKDKLTVPDYDVVLIQLRKISAGIDGKYT